MSSRTTRPTSRWIAFALIAAVGSTLVGLIGWRLLPREPIPEVAVGGIEPAVVAAIEQARQALRDNPKSPEAWGQVGLILFANDLYPESLVWLERAERMDPSDVRWPYFLGMALLLERPEEGLSALSRAARLAPRDPFVQLRWAEALLAADREEEADTAFQTVLRLQPDNARALLGRAQVLLRRGDIAAAIPLLEQASNHPTARKAALARLAEAYQRTSQTDLAERARQQAAETPPDPPWSDPKIVKISGYQVSRRARLQQATALLQSDRIDEGIGALKRLLRDHPDFIEAQLALARAWILVQDFTQAEADLQKVLARDPRHPDACVLAGGLALTRGEIDQAERMYRQTLEVRPTDSVAWYNIADCRLRQNDRPAAIEALSQAVRFRPGFVGAHLRLAELFLDTQQHDRARYHLEAAAKIEPNHPRLPALKARLPR